MRSGADSTRRGQAITVTSDGVRGLRDLTTDQLDVLLRAAHREYAGRFPRGRPKPMPKGVRIIKSTELPLVAYWVLNGVPLIAVQPNQDATAGYHQFGEFVLADINKNADRLQMEFASSTCSRFDGLIRGLKKQAAQFRRDRQRG
jgi:hypothetical protein